MYEPARHRRARRRARPLIAGAEVYFGVAYVCDRLGLNSEPPLGQRQPVRRGLGPVYLIAGDDHGGNEHQYLLCHRSTTDSSQYR
ncbi:hypothetical protein AA958_01740 [Streptomyces sp. CNQ-509]|nr:hypothetical protein [Streptomyces sp. CNQ-509]AKH81099.1 hypothetical protein AA958_01740 [Streptomyces sp. CNQ-509]